MPLVEDDDVVETFAAKRADETLDIGRLPGRAWSNEHFRDAETTQSAPEWFTVYGIAITQQIAGRGVKGKGFDDLLCRPLSGRVSSDVEVDDLASLMSKHEDHIEDSKGQRGHGDS